MDRVDRWHLGAGLAAGALEALSWLFGLRLLVLWELGTGMLMLLGVFPLIVGRISDF